MKIRRQREIDLRQQPHRKWGEPGACPRCEGNGFLDRLDLIDRVADQHCTECGYKWTEHEDDVSLLYSE